MTAGADHGEAWIGRGGRWRFVRLFVALALGPGAWALQLEVGYALAGYACYPGDAPYRVAPPPGWASEGAILLALNLACLALEMLALALAGAALRSLPRSDQDASAVRRRTRFLAWCGVLTSLGFAGAVLADTIGIIMTPTCWNIPR